MTGRPRITALKAIPVEQLRCHPRNVRDDVGDVDELAHSMVSQGVLQPVLVAPRGDVFVVLDGNRRLIAARTAGIPVLPCLITTEDSRESTVATMLAAAMHKELTPLEQARAFRDLLASGLTVTEIATRTGYSPATVRDRVHLAALPDDAKEMLARKELTVGAATALARQVSKNGKGQAHTATPKSTWLDRHHPLADDVKGRCSDDHRATRAVIGGASGVGCGQCWQATIEENILALDAALPGGESA